MHRLPVNASSAFSWNRPAGRAHCGTGARLSTMPGPRGSAGALYSGRPQITKGGVPMEIRAAVCRATHAPVEIESIDIDQPLGREVLVRTVATGVCHSDLHVVDGDGRLPLDRGVVLGHEGAGIVEAVCDQVTTLRPGDHVVACLSGFCGSCVQCLSGHPN